jgi:hypothetical protein
MEPGNKGTRGSQNSRVMKQRVEGWTWFWDLIFFSVSPPELFFLTLSSGLVTQNAAKCSKVRSSSVVAMIIGWPLCVHGIATVSFYPHLLSWTQKGQEQRGEVKRCTWWLWRVRLLEPANRKCQHLENPNHTVPRVVKQATEHLNEVADSPGRC